MRDVIFAKSLFNTAYLIGIHSRAGPDCKTINVLLQNTSTTLYTYLTLIFSLGKKRIV